MTADHTAQFEEVMALVDGELPADAAERVRVHLTSCEECQRLAEDLRGVSERLRGWRVGEAPAVRMGNHPWWKRTSTLAKIAATLLVATGVATVALVNYQAPKVDFSVGQTTSKATVSEAAESSLQYRARSKVAPEQRASVGRQGPAPAGIAMQSATPSPRVGGGPLIIRHASLSIVVRDYNAARNEVDRIARSVNGYIGDLTAVGARGEAPSLRGTLRVPSTRLDEAIAALKRLGDVQQESLGSDDVTQQWTDLEARLANARASEARLKDVLQNRTGRLSDVLEVEREIARVRGEIEQMEAQRKSLDNAITYAVVRVELVSERKAEAGPGPVSISTRLRNAVVDGYAAAVERGVSLVVFLAEILPTLILWAAVLVPPAVFIRRRWLRGV